MLEKTKFERFIETIEPFALTTIILAGANLAGWVTFTNNHWLFCWYKPVLMCACMERPQNQDVSVLSMSLINWDTKATPIPATTIIHCNYWQLKRFTLG